MKIQSNDSPQRSRIWVDVSHETKVALGILAKRLHRKRNEALEVAVAYTVQASDQGPLDPNALARIEAKLDELLRD